MNLTTINSSVAQQFSEVVFTVADRYPSAYWVQEPSPKDVYPQSPKIAFDQSHVYLVKDMHGDDRELPECVSHGNCQRAIVYQSPLTPALRSRLGTLVPGWFNWESAMEFLANWKSEKCGRAGRFTVSEWAVTENERDALFQASCWEKPLHLITYVPDVELIYSNRKSQYTGRPFSLWSDGVIVKREFYHPDHKYQGQIRLTPAASKLLSIALRQKYWLHEQRWKALLMIANYETAVLARAERSGIGFSNEKRLERLVTDAGDTLYLFANEGGALGEDGDAWDDYKLYTDEAAARASYKAFGIRW